MGSGADEGARPTASLPYGDGSERAMLIPKKKRGARSGAGALVASVKTGRLDGPSVRGKVRIEIYWAWVRWARRFFCQQSSS
jgi:hypothetical protein